jgi:thiamine-monophosphate kinase
MTEFTIIENFFAKKTIPHKNVTLGIGDDGAIVSVPTGHELIITTDTLVNEIHFSKNTNPYDMGYKALAVNLSDLAAMGATPTWFTLALTLPQSDENWLSEFSRGIFTLASSFKLSLIGGDLTRGPLTITIGAFGFVPKDKALRQDGAKVGDDIYVTHVLGDASFALKNKQASQERLLNPFPRVKEGEKLRGIASAAIDISDGLTADLGHILEKSHKGAIVFVDKIPLSRNLEQIPLEQALPFALNGGDDYELCFTFPTNEKPPIDCTRIGKIIAEPGLHLQFSNGEKYNGTLHGYQHF